MSGNADSLPDPKRQSLVLAGEALVFALGFLGRNWSIVLRRLAAPGLLGCAVLYVLLRTYCTQLTDFIGFPSEGLAGRVMGIAAAAILVMLLLHAVVVARVGELLMGRRDAASAFFGISGNAWRIYVADLRMVLAFGAYGVITLFFVDYLNRFGAPSAVVVLLSAASWSVLIWLLARIWFFLLPVSLEAQSEGILVMSWRCSEGLLLPILLVLLVLGGVTLSLLAGGELLLRAGGLLSPVPATLSFAGAIGIYERSLWAFVLLVSLAYLVGVSLITVARVKLYRDAAEWRPHESR